MEDLTPKLNEIMERAYERFLSARGIPIAGKFTRLLASSGDESEWAEWLEKRGITKTPGADTIPCEDPWHSPEWPIRIHIPKELAMKIVVLGELP